VKKQPTGRSFLTEIRETPQVTETICSIGFDPDLHTCGLGIIVAEITKPTVRQPTFKEVWAVIIEGQDGKYDDMQFAESMVAEVMATFESIPHWGIAPAQKVLTTIVGQRNYPRPDDTRAKMIAVANDLARLAQVSGAVQGRTKLAPYDGSRVYEPEQWKGQAPKPTMHQETATRLGDCPTRFMVLKPGGRRAAERSMRAIELPLLPKKMGHALDAVSLAEFGIDRYHDDRWHYRW
jgi:hypothetical protein